MSLFITSFLYCLQQKQKARRQPVTFGGTGPIWRGAFNSFKSDYIFFVIANILLHLFPKSCDDLFCFAHSRYFERRTLKLNIFDRRRHPMLAHLSMTGVIRRMREIWPSNALLPPHGDTPEKQILKQTILSLSDTKL